MPEETHPEESEGKTEETIQTPEAKPLKPKPPLRKWMGFWVRYLFRSEPLEPFIASLQGTGIPEQNISFLRILLPAMRKTLHDPAFHRLDRYLAGGLGATELVLFAVVLSIGTPDRSLSIALFALVISLPLLACSLFISFAKSELGISTYGIYHVTLVFLALVTGATGIVALLWHVSSVAALVLLCLMIILFIVCTLYILRLVLAKHFAEEQKAVNNASSQTASQTEGSEAEHPTN